MPVRIHEDRKHATNAFLYILVRSTGMVQQFEHFSRLPPCHIANNPSLVPHIIQVAPPTSVQFIVPMGLWSTALTRKISLSRIFRTSACAPVLCNNGKMSCVCPRLR